MLWRQRHLWGVILTGVVLGLLGVLLSVWGNPENSGICVSCFLENSAGALGLHGNVRMQYLRPELSGFVLGALLCALGGREFSSRGGSAPLLRFASGIFLIVGCAVFIGCPIKLFLRLTAGDLTSLSGLAGLVVGVGLGLQGMRRGVEFPIPQRQEQGSGFLLPGLFALLLLFTIVPPAFILFSEQGSAAQRAPFFLALGSGLLIGALAQRSRFCITGSLRDLFLLGQRSPLFWGLLAFVVAALVTQGASGRLHLGLYGQPGAHHDYLWSFLGMLLVGGLSVLLGGCSFRQLVKAGEGDNDAALVVMGMLLGAGLVQSWGLAASAAGVPYYGKVAVLLGVFFTLWMTLVLRDR